VRSSDNGKLRHRPPGALAAVAVVHIGADDVGARADSASVRKTAPDDDVP
jgi:hypothetical protein